MSTYKGYDPDKNNKTAMKYVKEKQKSILIKWKKAEFEDEIEPAIRESGMPTVTFIKQAVREKIKMDMKYREAVSKKINRCKDCEHKYLKDLFDDGQEQVYICGIDDHYIGYPEDADVACEIAPAAAVLLKEGEEADD